MDERLECKHDFERVKVAHSEYVGHRRRCKECSLEEIWALKEKPNPDNAPALGEWEPAPEWLPDYLEFWVK